MNEGKKILRWAVIADSILILVLVAAMTLLQRSSFFLLVAGYLAGLNVVLQALTLENVAPFLRRALLVAGGVTLAVMLLITLTQVYS
jgi:hypothetical protein